mmetsp:Transcript_3877/g.5312  ORF Transcript_3877/g.5312 Transcript_3877/m.5312 type:complete len:97 (-) Transcript_3877:1177-1467(-)
MESVALSGWCVHVWEGRPENILGQYRGLSFVVEADDPRLYMYLSTVAMFVLSRRVVDKDSALFIHCRPRSKRSSIKTLATCENRHRLVQNAVGLYT